MGLDRDDPVVRRRVGQKIQFIIESVAPAPPTTAELQAWLDAHPADYAIEPRYSLRQVYFNPQRHGANLERDIASAKRVLATGASNAGDSTLLPFELQNSTQSDVERTFGAEFAAALKDVPAGSWQGPVPSVSGCTWWSSVKRAAGMRRPSSRCAPRWSVTCCRRAPSSPTKPSTTSYALTTGCAWKPRPHLRSGWLNAVRASALFTLLLLGCSGLAQADVFRPAYLEVRESGADRYEVLWKLPVQGDMRPAVQVRFPAGTTELTPRQGVFTGDGLCRALEDFAPRRARRAGNPHRGRPAASRMSSCASSGRTAAARSKDCCRSAANSRAEAPAVDCGSRLVLPGARRRAHTRRVRSPAVRTGAAARRTWRRPHRGNHDRLHARSQSDIGRGNARLGARPGPPVEAMIALSIVFVAAEVVHGLHGRPGLTARAPWVVAFSFGLLHGLGFAGALAEVGLPKTRSRCAADVQCRR